MQIEKRRLNLQTNLCVCPYLLPAYQTHDDYRVDPDIRLVLVPKPKPMSKCVVVLLRNGKDVRFQQQISLLSAKRVKSANKSFGFAWARRGMSEWMTRTINPNRARSFAQSATSIVRIRAGDVNIIHELFISGGWKVSTMRTKNI